MTLAFLIIAANPKPEINKAKGGLIIFKHQTKMPVNTIQIVRIKASTALETGFKRV